MKLFLFCTLFLIATALNAQTDSKLILEELSKLQNQYNKSFDKSKVKYPITIIYLLGTENEDPFEKILDRFREKAIIDPEKIQVVVGLKDRVRNFSPDLAKSHVQDGVTAAYGKDHFSIYLDIESKIAERLAIKGWATVILSPNGKATVSDYATDRKKFLEDVKIFFK